MDFSFFESVVCSGAVGVASMISGSVVAGAEESVSSFFVSSDMRIKRVKVNQERLFAISFCIMRKAARKASSLS